MNSDERLLKTLRREEVDRVPVFEWLISNNVIQALCPGQTWDELIYALDLDAICVDLDYRRTPITDSEYIDEWGITKKINAEEHPTPIAGPIKTILDLDQYIPPDVSDPYRYQSLEKSIARHQGKKAVILHLNDVFSIPSRLMTYEDFMVSLYEEPELVEGLIDMNIEVNLKMAKEAVKRGVKIIYTGDDYAYNTGPMMSPNLFKSIFYPRLCQVMKGYKDLGLYVIKHTDGNIMPIIDMIVDSGIDCLDPIDPQAGMSIGEIKKRFGDRIAIKGNVDCAQTLTFGSVADTIAETRACLSVAAGRGGYILSSSNSIHSGVKPENFKAMVETAIEYGGYSH